MQCSCGLETKTAVSVHNKTQHKLECQRCDCGRQGVYLYYRDGVYTARGEDARTQFNTARGLVA